MRPSNRNSAMETKGTPSLGKQEKPLRSNTIQTPSDKCTAYLMLQNIRNMSSHLVFGFLSELTFSVFHAFPVSSERLFDDGLDIPRENDVFGSDCIVLYAILFVVFCHSPVKHGK